MTTDSCADGPFEITPSGGMAAMWNYVSWDTGDEDIVLDGSFSLADLKAMISHVENYRLGLDSAQTDK